MIYMTRMAAVAGRSDVDAILLFRENDVVHHDRCAFNHRTVHIFKIRDGLGKKDALGVVRPVCQHGFDSQVVFIVGG